MAGFVADGYKEPQINELINKKDGFEVVGDLIGFILLMEMQNQYKLAIKNNLNDLKPYEALIRREVSNPIEEFRAVTQDKAVEAKPVVNVWFDNESFSERQGNVVDYQKGVGTFNIDCYGLGIAGNIKGAGHMPGDKAASLSAQAIARLVRNILMAGPYIYLGVQGFVSRRWVSSINQEQADFASDNGLHIRGIRIIFRVDFVETSPQYQGDTLESVFIKLLRASDSKLISELQFDYDLE